MSAAARGVVIVLASATCGFALPACLWPFDPEWGTAGVDAGPPTPADAFAPDAPPPAPALLISPSSSDFGTLRLGQSSAPTEFVIENDGTERSAPLWLRFEGGADADFEIQSNECAGVLLPPRAVCGVTITFTPRSTARVETMLIASASEAGSPEVRVTANLSGSGVIDGHVLLSPTEADFGAVAVGSSVTRAFTLRNAGGAASGVLTTRIVGPDPDELSITSDACTGQALMPHGSCEIVIAYAPRANGEHAATLEIVGDGSTISAPLEGSAHSGHAGLAPSTHDFGVVGIGVASTAVLFTLFNAGGSATPPIETSIVGGHASDFSATTSGDGCAGVSLPPRMSCTIAVAFRPRAAGMRAATLRVRASPFATQNAALVGEGT